jgi:hypothetical protein
MGVQKLGDDECCDSTYKLDQGKCAPHDSMKQVRRRSDPGARGVTRLLPQQPIHYPSTSENSSLLPSNLLRQSVREVLRCCM